MHFTGTKFLPYILLLLKYKNCSARMEAFNSAGILKCIDHSLKGCCFYAPKGILGCI